MQKIRAGVLKLSILAGLLMGTGVILFLVDASPLVGLASVSVMGLLFWSFAGKSRPKGEMSCRAVSCCHYLGDSKKEQQQ